ncbi:MAG: fibronectin type III domain-containing protein [Clostridiales bacterium]|nr:fibronectin type III domain-containing protein [Clostridiales bacterium]
MKKSLYIFTLSLVLLLTLFTFNITAMADDTSADNDTSVSDDTSATEQDTSEEIVVDTVSGLSAAGTNTSAIKIAWNAVENASGYEVYTVSSGTYKLVGTTTSTTYKISSLSSGTIYSFAVRAYITDENQNTTYGSYSSTFSYCTKPSKVSISSISSAATSLTVKYKAVTCGGYEIQYCTDKSFPSGKYTSKTVSSSTTSKKFSDLKSAKYYYFRVRAYVSVNGEKVYGSWSTVTKQCTKPAKEKISSISTPSTTSVKVKWSKVSTATGYQVQYATNSDFTKNKKTIKITDASTTSKKITKLTTGTTYYVRVRAYITYNDTNYYGEWSSSKKQKVYKSKKITVATTLRKSNSWSSKSLGNLKKNASVRVVSSSGRWYKVIYDGNTGYVYNLAFKKAGTYNLSRSKVTSSNYKTYLDDILFITGTSKKAIFNYVCNNMSYSYSKISSAQRKANINSLSRVKSNEDILASVAISKRGGICYNYAALTKTLYERAGYDVQYVVGSNRNGKHCWVIIKTSDGYRHIDTVRGAYCYTDSKMKSSSKTKDFSWNKSSYPTCK